MLGRHNGEKQEEAKKSIAQDNAILNGDWRNHRYIDKTNNLRGNPKYIYPEDLIPKKKDGESLTQFRIRVASKLKPIDGIEPLKVDESNFVKIGNQEYKRRSRYFICFCISNENNRARDRRMVAKVRHRCR